jgi:hypothetical protein
MNSHAQPFSFFPPQPPPSIPGVVSTGIIFACTYKCAHFIALYILLCTFFMKLSKIPSILSLQEFYYELVLAFISCFLLQLMNFPLLLIDM